MNSSESFPPPLFLTDNAAAKVRALIEEEGQHDLKLRVFVSGGGCSGFWGCGLQLIEAALKLG